MEADDVRMTREESCTRAEATRDRVNRSERCSKCSRRSNQIMNQIPL